MITAALQVTRQHSSCISKQLRGFAELAVAGPTRYVETAPSSVPMVQSLSQIQPSQVSHWQCAYINQSNTLDGDADKAVQLEV